MFILELVIGVSNFLDVTTIAIVGKLKRVKRFIVVLLEIGYGIVQILKVGLGKKIGDIFFALRRELLRIFTVIEKIHQINLFFYIIKYPHTQLLTYYSYIIIPSTPLIHY